MRIAAVVLSLLVVVSACAVPSADEEQESSWGSEEAGGSSGLRSSSRSRGALQPGSSMSRLPSDLSSSSRPFSSSQEMFGEPALTPFFGETIVQDVAPLPIRGGTLLASLHDPDFVFVADPDRDLVSMVNLATSDVRTFELNPGDDPGRIIEDNAGHIFVVLRGAAQVVRIDPVAGPMIRHAVCAGPRGIAYRASTDELVVACRTGELWTFPAQGGTPSIVMLPEDLRDVVIDESRVLVSRFRSAEVLVVESGVHTGTIQLPSVPSPRPLGGMLVPSVAWRMIAGPSGGAIVVHQRALDGPVTTGASPASGPFGYGGSECTHEGIIESAVTVIASGSLAPQVSITLGAVLPVDVAAFPGGQVAALGAGNARSPIGIWPLSQFSLSNPPPGQDPCIPSEVLGFDALANSSGDGIPVAVAFSSTAGLIMLKMQPSLLFMPNLDRTILLDTSEGPHRDTGFEVFHMNAGVGVACASCHPEGEDDGRTWSFAGLGPRRTPSLHFGIAGTEPFHWNGELPTLRSLVEEVFQHRMGGPALGTDQTDALMHWMDGLRPPAARVVDEAARVRGQALFESAAVGCAGCHAGGKLTNNLTVDVGTGMPFQVPSLLGVGWRAPFMHDGCAQTLEQRFTSTACGGGESHGHTAHLTPGEMGDLVTYLKSL